MERLNQVNKETKNCQLLALETFSSDSFLSINKRLLSYFGPNVTIFLSNLIDKYKYFIEKDKLQKDGSFFLTHADQETQTGLSEYEIRKCKKILKKEGVLNTYMSGIPPKEFYLLNIDNLVDNYLRNIPLKFKGITVENLKDNTFKNSRNIKDKEYKEIENKDINDNKLSFNDPLGHLKKVNRIISFWNNLSNKTISHKDPESKVYKSCVEIIENLLEGLPIQHKKDNSPIKLLVDFAENNHIPEHLLIKKWEAKEIKLVLKKLHDHELDSSKKHSLPSIFFNKFSGKNGDSPFSWFLYEASGMKINNEYIQLAKKFGNIINSNDSSNKNEIAWAKEFEILIKEESKSIDEMNKILDWYKSNFHDKYTPKVFSIKEFKDKFRRIDYHFMKNKEVNPHPQSSPNKIIESHFEADWLQQWMKTSYERAKKLTGADSPELANELCNLYDWIKENQNPDIPDKDYTNPDGLIKEYIFWLQFQDWVNDITPQTFSPGNNLFRKVFIEERNKETNINALTGKPLIYGGM